LANERLINDVKYLADTLGFRTYLRKKKTTNQTDYEGTAFRLSINGDTWRIPCKIERKVIKKEQVNKNKDFLLSQIEIEPVGYGEYAGFSLDGDHLFLLEDGTVTHNTVNIARALVILANQRKLRILCGREFQNSIRESVYETLKEQIVSLGLIKEFEILATSIVSKRTGSEFLFKGLRHNIESIKSLASIDIVWIEEANNISKVTWDKLTPTIRGRSADDPRGNIGPFGKGPEIWISFNPELDSDETYKRFVLNPPSKFDKNGNLYSIVEKVNWSDNVWFPDDLREEMEQLKAKDENKWLEVWEGHTKQVLDGAIYAEEIRQAILEKRIGKVPYDPNRPVNTFWDLGRADKTAIWFGQTVGLEFNLINYYEDSLKKMPFYIKVLQDLGYNYGIHFLPHDGAAETLSNVTPQRQLINVGYKTRIVERPAKKFLGINAARSIFPLCNFDEANTPDGLQCLKRYCYKINEDTGTFGKEPDHDTPWSHGADAFQTMALAFKSEKASQKPKTVSSGRVIKLQTNTSAWMR